MFKIEYQKARFPNLSLLSSQYEDEKNNDEYNNDYNPFNLITLQHYNPLYNILFNTNIDNQNRITLSTKYYFHDLKHVTDVKGKLFQKNVFIKYSPLLDPLRYLIGKYDNNNNDDNDINNCIELPYISNNNSIIINLEKNTKMNDINNSSYVDCLFNYLNGQLKDKHNFFHGLDFYGSFLCIQDKYKFDITDDLDYLVTSKHFVNSFDVKYNIEKFDKSQLLQLYNDSMNIIKKQKIIIDNNSEDILIDDLIESIQLNNNISYKNKQPILQNITNNIDNSSDNYSDNSDNSDNSTYSTDNSSLNYTTDNDNNESDNNDNNESDDNYQNKNSNKNNDNSECDNNSNDKNNDKSDDDNESDNENDNESNDEIVNIYIKNYPVQMICLEKCNGTLDELFENGVIDENNGISMLFQIVMILLIYQQTFDMTHNDLHTNNIMYINTKEQYIYYYYDAKYYKVPTFGRIYKLIDFGRAIFKFNGKLHCSDSFAPNGDAYTQYNFEPYYKPEKKRVEPNFSFDLCRLSVSIYDYIIDNNDEINPQNMDNFQKIIYKWCHDDNNKNVLYKSDGSERYPNFSLYKMLSRTVNKYLPKNEIKNCEIFNKYIVKKENIKKIVKSINKNFFINIDRIPSYVNKYI